MTPAAQPVTLLCPPTLPAACRVNSTKSKLHAIQESVEKKVGETRSTFRHPTAAAEAAADVASSDGGDLEELREGGGGGSRRQLSASHLKV